MGIAGRPVLAAETCRRRLRPVFETTGGPSVDCAISWYGAAGAGRRAPGSKATVQALSGLMEVHGWDGGAPRRLGLEVASVAAGLLAASGALAASIGAARGRPVARIETSVLAAGFLLIAHHLAAATATGEPLPSPPGPQPGPPFRTSDGRWFEIEVFDAEAWKSFWTALGAGEANLGRAWTAFRARYYRGRCSFPPGLHEATSVHTLDEVAQVARACQVSLCPVRGYQEVVRQPDWRGRQLSWATDEWAPSSSVATGRGLPLHGIRVVEATSRMQGPLAGLLLQMLGAEVTRVEPPGGDIGRMVPPTCGDVGSFFQCFNRGKGAVEVDLTSPGGRLELLALLAGSDVFLHNWRPGRAEQWCLDQAAVTPVNRRLVYAEASGWGSAGGLENVIGTDFLVQAHAGFGEGLNPEGDPPLTSRVLLTDCLGALVTCEGILAALYLRETAGARNIFVGTSLLEGAMACQAHVLAALTGGNDDRRRGGRPLWGPLDRPVTTADGAAIVVSADDDDDFGRLCRICGVAGDARTRPATEQAVADCLTGAEADYWLPTLDDEGIGCARVSRDLAALTADPLLAAFFQPLSDTCRAPASPWIIT
jgi:CoA:oxalate CoA-transferase